MNYSKNMVKKHAIENQNEFFFDLRKISFELEKQISPKMCFSIQRNPLPTKIPKN